jgi:hypothetical protein
MQAVALATNDEFLVPYNLTIDAGDVLEYMENLTYIWMDQTFTKQVEFDDLYNVNLSLVAGPSGFCYNFNMVNASDLFHLDLYDQFYCQLISGNSFLDFHPISTPLNHTWSMLISSNIEDMRKLHTNRIHGV